MDNLDQIIARILQGETELYGQIVESHEGTVRAVIAALIPDQNMVADLVQETFIIAYQHLSAYRPGTNFAAWLRTIARNVTQNERRRWYRRREMEDRYEAQVAECIEDNIDKIVDALPDDTMHSLHDCIDRLSGKARTLIDEFYYRERTVAELAGLLDLSKNTVKVVLHRARQAIGYCLHKKGQCDV